MVRLSCLARNGCTLGEESRSGPLGRSGPAQRLADRWLIPRGRAGASSNREAQNGQALRDEETPAGPDIALSNGRLISHRAHRRPVRRQRPPTRAGRRNPDKNRETSSPTAVDTEKVRQRRSRSQARSTRRAHEKQSDQEPDTCRGGSSEQPPPRQLDPDAGKQSTRHCCGPSIAFIEI